jgi:hypothetical protein
MYFFCSSYGLRATSAKGKKKMHKIFYVFLTFNNYFYDSFVCIEILIDITDDTDVFLCTVTHNTDFYDRKIISRKFQNSTPLPWLYFRRT